LIKLKLDEIELHWDLIEGALEQALPPLADPNLLSDRIIAIKKMCLLGDMDVWELQKDDEILLIATMTTEYDVPTGTKNYMIYSLTVLYSPIYG